MTVDEPAPAKVNLTLHVTGRRADGYHLLDSLVVFAGEGDRLRVTPAPDWELAVTGPFADRVPRGADNLVLRAARLAGGAPAAITLDKRLPVASGLGGGSADAAAVLRALSALDGRPVPADAASLGADLPVCLPSRPARMRGIGEDLAPVPDLPPAYLVLVNPGAAVATPQVFATLTRRDNAPMPAELPNWRDAAALAAWLAGQRNDLEDAAREIAPAIGVALARLSATEGCLLARMSGSGATCFGLYASRVEAAAAAGALARAHPGWWVRATDLSAPAALAACP